MVNVGLNWRTHLKSGRVRWNELIRRWDSERELLRSAPRKLPEFAEIMQNNGHYAIQGHRFWYQSKAHIRLHLRPILHRFRNIAVDRSKIAIFYYLLVFNSPGGGVPLGRSPQTFQWMSTDGQDTYNAVEILPKIWTAWVGRTNVTDDRRTGDCI